MFKYQPLRIPYKTEKQKEEVIASLEKSKKVRNIQANDTHVTYEQEGWVNED